MRRRRSNKPKRRDPIIRINDRIFASELRVISDDGQNFGLLSKAAALEKAREMEMDLIEISPKAKPPVAKIMDYGRYQYSENKKMKIAKSKAHDVEVKSIQVKVGTSENDLQMKAKRASEWLKEGHRIKVELFLPGRTKYMEKGFLEGRLDRILKLITEDYNVAQEIRKSPKGINCILEKSKKAPKTE